MARSRREDAATIAARISEDVRALIYATLPHEDYPGLDGPVDAHTTIGALREAVGRLPQALDQIAAFLATQARRPGLADDFSRYRGNPGRAVTQTAAALRDTAGPLGLLLTRLDFAHNATAGLYITDPDGR
jgi:hypothetical protein